MHVPSESTENTHYVFIIRCTPNVFQRFYLFIWTCEHIHLHVKKTAVKFCLLPLASVYTRSSHFFCYAGGGISSETLNILVINISSYHEWLVPSPNLLCKTCTASFMNIGALRENGKLSSFFRLVDSDYFCINLIEKSLFPP